MRRFAAVALVGVALLAGAAWLGRPQEATAGPTDLVERLASSDGAGEAYQKLAHLGDPAVRAALVAGLHHGCAQVRVRCARLLARQEEDVVGVAEVESLLEDADLNVRSQAAATFIALAPAERVKALTLDHGKPCRVRAALIDGVVAETLEMAPTVLLQIVDDKSDDSRLRTQAALLMRKYPSAAQQAALHRIAMGGEDLDLRAAATRAMGSGASPATGLELARAVDDEALPWRIREAAVSALGLTGDTRHVPRLRALAESERTPSQMRDNALVALGALGTREALDCLLVQVRSNRVTTRLRAAEGLAQAHAAWTVPAMREALARETDGQVQCLLHGGIECASK